MADTTFVDYTTPAITAEWLNAVNDFYYTLFAGATTAAGARTAIGLVAGGSGDIWVEKAGDTMTGDLTLDSADLYIKASGVTDNPAVLLQDDSGVLAGVLNARSGTGDRDVALRVYNSVGSFVNELSVEQTAGLAYVNGNKIWTDGNDGSGSGLDADTLDTYQATEFPRKAENATVTGDWTMASPLTLSAADGTNEGGEINLKGAGAYNDGIFDRYQNQFRWRQAGGPILLYETNVGTLYVDGNEVWHQGNVGTRINTLTTDSSPTTSDYVATYDASAGTAKKVALSNIPVSGSVSQGQLKTTTGAVSHAGAGLNLTLPGGQYGFYPQGYKTGDNYSASIADTCTNTAYTTNIWLRRGTTGTAYALQRYIQASPPYDLGDGEIPLFIFVEIDNATGKPESIYSATEAPWHYNGPTNIKADFYENGKGYRRRKDMGAFGMTLAEAKAVGGSAVRDYYQAFKQAQTFNEEVTQAIKNADMGLIPHPFTANNRSGKTIVMLDPVSDFVWELSELLEHDEFNLHELIYDKDIIIANKPLLRTTPNGVMVVGANWR